MKRLFRKAREAAIEIDDTLPEIRDTWCVVRDGLWAYMKTTAIITAGILALGVVLGFGSIGYALLNNAKAADYNTQCSTQWRISCGFSAPGTGWNRYFADGHDPAASCPPGWIRQSTAGTLTPPEHLNGALVTRFYCDNPSLPYPPPNL